MKENEWKRPNIRHLNGNYLDCRGNLLDIVTYVFLAGSFEWDFGTDNTHEYANLVEMLLDFV